MKDYAVENTRNVVIVSHGGAGKTMLTEAMLFCRPCHGPHGQGRRRQHRNGF